MNTNLILEVKRIQELMGSKNIIFEDTINGGPMEKIFMSILPDFLEKANISKVKNDFKFNDEVITKQEYEAFKNLRENLTKLDDLIPSLTTPLKTKLFSILLRSPEIKQKSLDIYKELVEEIITKLKIQRPDKIIDETTLYKMILIDMEKTKSFDKSLSNVLQISETDELFLFIKNTSFNRYSNWKQNKLADIVKVIDNNFKTELEKALKLSQVEKSQGLPTIRKLLSSKYTVLGLIRTHLLARLDRQKLAKEPEKFITDTGNEILSIVKKQTENLTYSDIDKVKTKLGTEIRSVASRLNVLGEKAEILENTKLYSEITELLKKENSTLTKEIDDLMKVVKEVDPFNPNNAEISKQWLWEFLGKTATANYFKNQRDMLAVWNFFKKEVKKRKCYDAETDSFIEKEMSGREWCVYNWKQWLERLAFISITGVPKTLKEIKWDQKNYGIFSFGIIYWLTYHIGKPITEMIESIPYHMINVTIFEEDPYLDWWDYSKKVINEKAKKVFIAKESTTFLYNFTSNNALTNGILNTIMTVDPLVWAVKLPLRPEVPQLISGALELSEKFINGQAKSMVQEANQTMRQYSDTLNTRMRQVRDSINVNVSDRLQVYQDSIAKLNERYKEAEQDIKDQITDSELGCKLFLKNNFKNYENGYCYSNDGKKYYFKNGTFVE